MSKQQPNSNPIQSQPILQTLATIPGGPSGVFTTKTSQITPATTNTAENVQKHLKMSSFKDLPIGTVEETDGLTPPAVPLSDDKEWNFGGRTLKGVAWKVAYKTKSTNPTLGQ